MAGLRIINTLPPTVVINGSLDPSTLAVILSGQGGPDHAKENSPTSEFLLKNLKPTFSSMDAGAMSRFAEDVYQEYGKGSVPSVANQTESKSGVKSMSFKPVDDDPTENTTGQSLTSQKASLKAAFPSSDSANHPKHTTNNSNGKRKQSRSAGDSEESRTSLWAKIIDLVEREAEASDWREVEVTMDVKASKTGGFSHSSKFQTDVNV